MILIIRRTCARIDEGPLMRPSMILVKEGVRVMMHNAWIGHIGVVWHLTVMIGIHAPGYDVRRRARIKQNYGIDIPEKFPPPRPVES